MDNERVPRLPDIFDHPDERIRRQRWDLWVQLIEAGVAVSTAVWAMRENLRGNPERMLSILQNRYVI